MIVTLITKDRIYSTSLPQKVSGQYWITDLSETGHIRRVAHVEGIQGKWLLRGSDLLALTGASEKELIEVELQTEGTQVIPAMYREDQSHVQLFVEPSTEDRQTYEKYLVTSDCQLNIGRTEDNHIAYGNKYVSAHHATLVWRGGEWSVTDTQSSNGTFVNERRVVMSPLHPGDTVYIMGLKLVVGDQFFAVNDPDGVVRVAAGTLQYLQPQAVEQQEQGYAKEPDGETFYCSPRFCRTITKESVKIDPPPMRQRFEEVPLALLLGPALTMGMSSVIMALISWNNYTSGQAQLSSVIPTLAMSFSMLCGTILWPMLTKRNEKKKKNEIEAQRHARYREYLDDIRNQIFKIGATQKEILLENCPDVGECQRRILSRQRNLWERTASNEDFLSLRLGLGSIPTNVEVRYPEKRFSMEDDALQNDLLRLSSEQYMLDNVPVTVSLKDNHVIGVIGSKQEANALLKSLILQIAALHSYEEVKLIFLASPDDLEQWNFGRWLPHVWSENGDMRYFAASESEAKALSAALDRVLTERQDPQSRPKLLPHYVLVATDLALAEKTELYSKILALPGNLGFSCITLAGELRELPKECSVVAEITEQSAAVYDQNDLSGQRQAFIAETALGLDMDGTARSLANIHLESKDQLFSLPNMLTFLEMYGVGKVEHLNVLTRWRENNPVNTLQAPVGVGDDGDLFYLDLHEKFQGPHGLVAGMTGSGKSEFIITYILSLAVNYHPDEVSFILIDYKGGGLAGAFENSEKGIRLPHLAGTITNLDGTAVKRSLISIQSELRRRQAIFNEARRVSGEGTIDIYKYQKMYRNGQVSEPVPHLFIISDEFAELKSQQPEFMEQLISAARIGRSLGVHLILATQKPSGVVDDQIWSNSRFRVCLKVQERNDSMDMIKRPDAAELAETGRFYLQVGFNEFFALGQSAWCGAPYVPADRVEKKEDNSIVVIDHLGRVQTEVKPKAVRSGVSTASQIVSVVSYLSDLAEVEARQLWLPPIPAMITLDALKEKYNHKTDLSELAPVIGEYDDPFNQKQDILTLPLSTEGNALIYSATGGGKTTMLNTILYGLLRDYDAAHLNAYLIDLGEETLRVFEKAPQVGDVLYSHDGEKIATLFKMLKEEMAYRKKLLAADDGDYRVYSRRTGHTLPHILVVLRNYAAFSEQFEQLEEPLLQLTREGSKYGIYFLVTANAANAVRYRVSQNFSQILALQLNDKSDYIGIFGGTDGVYPSKMKGRGIFKTDRAYEFQTAHYDEEGALEGLRVFSAELAEHATCFAPSVPVLPDRVTKETFKGRASIDAIPVGVEKASLAVSKLNLSRSVMSVVLGQDLYELGRTVQGLAEVLATMEDTSVTVLDAASILAAEEDVSYSYLSRSFAPRIEALFTEMVRRNNTYKTAKNEGRELPVFENEFYLITGIQSILDSLDAAGQDKLKTLLEKAEAEYGIRFLICDSVKNLTSQSVMPWYKRHITGADGIWVGDGISEQYLLKINKITNSLYAELPNQFGYMVQKGKPVLVKLVEAEKERGEDEA